MSYELDFIGINEKTQDADAIGIHWKEASGSEIVGVFDGGIKAYGEALKNHINQYYFNSDEEEKVIDFVICSHSDKDHASGLSIILENFTVKALYMNRPWLYVDELYDKVNDGRITKESLKNRLKEKYKYIANLEELAEEKTSQFMRCFKVLGLKIGSKYILQQKIFIWIC